MVKKLIKRKKREQIKLKKIKNIENNIISTESNKEGKNDNLNLSSPVNSKYLTLNKKDKLSNIETKELDKFSNLNKKNNKNKKNLNNIFTINKLNSDKNQISNKSDIINNEKDNKINKYKYPYNLSENQIYEMFLKINANSDSELNELDYKNAIKKDIRTYFQYYLSLLRTKHLFIFSFWPSFDYNSQIIKIFLFFFEFTFSFLVNALFFNDDTMHKIYEVKCTFNFIYNIPQILYSSLISGFIDSLIQTLALTDSNLISFKQNKDKKNIIIKKNETFKVITIKIALFFIITLSLLVTFWFYLACFCFVYKNTQIHLIKDTVISFGFSMITPFLLYIVPGIFRLSALKETKKDKELMYKFSKVIQWF